MNEAVQEAIRRIQNTMCQTVGVDGEGEMRSRMEGRISDEDLHLLIYTMHKAKRMAKALGFYGRHEHWMGLASDSDSLCTVLIAMQGDGEQHGWRVAEDALKAA